MKYDTIERAGRRRTVITREEGGGDRQVGLDNTVDMLES